jgi:transcriptional regulator with XRE-family HTH domain
MELHIMTYATEDIIKTLKQAREAKGLSQRALSERTHVPQSHISKIESSGTDIRLSSLIELARALDLELKLVPRKAVPAVETVVRSVIPAPVAIRPADTAKAVREFEKTLKSVEEARALFPDQATLKQVQDTLQSFRSLQSAGRDFAALFAEARKAYEPLQKELVQIRKAAETVRTLPPETLRSVNEAAESLRQIRNQIAHGLPTVPSLPRPAYQLDEDEGDSHG